MQTLISIHSQIMRVLIITLSFALVVLGGKFLVETENGENDYGGGAPRRYGGGSDIPEGKSNQKKRYLILTV